MLNIVLIAFISFMPILFWAYIFSSISEEKFNRNRFFLWIVSGILSVVPILYMDELIGFLKIESINFFQYAKDIWSFFWTLSFGLSLSIFLGLIVILSFIFSLFLRKKMSILAFYSRNFLIFIIFVCIISLLFYALDLISKDFVFLNKNISSFSQIYFWETIFNTLKLIIFYYVLVAFIEESSKHFNFISAGILEIKSTKDWVLYAIFVALWFSFIENILYFYSLYNASWISFELTKIYFFRSVFSIMVHVFCSSIIAYFFTKAYLWYKKRPQIFPYLKVFLIWIFFTVSLHFIFDLAITLDFSFVVIIYFVVWYLYVSSIFYRD